jgi:hypothetical protein
MDAKYERYRRFAQGKLKHSCKITKIRGLDQIVGDEEEHVNDIAYSLV